MVVDGGSEVGVYWCGIDVVFLSEGVLRERRTGNVYVDGFGFGVILPDSLPKSTTKTT